MSKTAKPKFSIMGISPETACETGYEFELQHPFENVGVGMFITVIGPESARVKAHHRSKVNAQLLAQSKGTDAAPTVEKLEEAAIETAVVSTLSWRGVVMRDGEEETPLSEEAARELYAQGWVRKQVLEAAGELGNFKPG